MELLENSARISLPELTRKLSILRNFIDLDHFRQIDFHTFLKKAEDFIFHIENNKKYVKDFVYNRLGGRSESKDKLGGLKILKEVQAAIHEFCLENEYTPPEYVTAKELAEIFDVTKKTVLNWRDKGLISYKTVIKGKPTLVYTQKNIQRFKDKNPKLAKKDANFKKITDLEVAEILDLSFKLDKAGCSFTKKIKNLAKVFNRSQVSIREIVKKQDPDKITALKDLKNIPKEQVVEKHHITPKQVSKIIDEDETRLMNIDYVYNLEYEGEIDLSMPEVGDKFTPDQEKHFFRAYNYLKYLARKAQENENFKECRRLMESANKFRAVIVEKNLNLVTKIAHKQREMGLNFSEARDSGVLSLMAAIEKFDYSANNKFSTMAYSWIYNKNFATNNAGLDTVGVVKKPVDDPGCQTFELVDLVENLLKGLTKERREVIMRTYGINRPVQNLHEIGDALGYSHEWVRQNKIAAMAHIKEVLEAKGFSFEDIFI